MDITLDSLSEALASPPAESALAKSALAESVSAEAKGEAKEEELLSLIIPTDQATPEEWEQFYRHIGRPEDKLYLAPEQRKEADPDTLKGFEDIFFESGLSKRQGEQVLQRLTSLSQDMAKTHQEQQQQKRQAHLKELQKVYGESLSAKIPLLQAALHTLQSPDLVALMEESHYHPGLMRLLVTYGETLKTDRLVQGKTPASPTSKQGSLAEIQRLQQDSAFMKLYTGNGAGHEEAVARMTQLYQHAFATQETH